MNFEDIVAIIFVIIFFLGPLIKRIAEAAGKQENAPKKGRSLEEVREYLERMKTSPSSSGQTQPHYKTPATKPYKSSARGRASEKKQLAQEKNFTEQLATPIVIQPELEAPSVKKTVQKNFLHDFITNEKFTGAQKAIILAEIFKQPST